MVDCWADKLGSCSAKQSREHLVSKALFKEDRRYEPEVIMGYGLPGFEDKPKKIRIDSMASKILCRYHNALLSPTDKEAAYAFYVFRRLWSVIQERKSIQNNSYEINGVLLERWFLKTAINFIYTSYEIEKPPVELVELAFGKKRFPEKTGLCLAASSGMQKIESEDDIKCVPIILNDETIAFVLFEFRGWKFALPLTSSPLPQSLDFIKHTPYLYEPGDKFISEFLKSKLTYHLKKIEVKIGEKVEFEVRINWEESPSHVNQSFGSPLGWRLKRAMYYTNPIAVDADGNQVLCQIRLNKEKAKFEVTIPQDFLDKAKYPVKIKWGVYPKKEDAIIAQLKEFLDLQ